MQKILEVRNLTKKYCEGTVESLAVDHISLDVAAREFVIIMGASGSGKTSLLHLIAGIDDFDEGTVLLKNTDFGQMREKAKTIFRRENIGIVFQQHCLIPDLTVYENMILPMMLAGKMAKGKEKDSVKNTILKLCGQCGLKEHTNKYPSQLSGGQQQRAAILRAIINRPPLLLCDEPTGSLNSAQTEIVMKLLHLLNKEGQTIILVTHDIKVAARGKRVVFLKDGSIDGELVFPETYQDSVTRDEICQRREKELLHFLQKRGW